MEFNRYEKIAFDLGYRVNNIGDVFAPNKNKRKLSLNYNNYYIFSIRNNSKVTNVLVHRLQVYQKFGDKIYQKGIVVRHLNNNPLDNSWDNIEIGTVSDNLYDIPEEIRIKIASKAHKQYSDDLHQKVIEARNNGMSYKEIMEKFGIKCKSQVSFMINHRLKYFEK